MFDDRNIQKFREELQKDVKGHVHILPFGPKPFIKRINTNWSTLECWLGSDFSVHWRRNM